MPRTIPRKRLAALLAAALSVGAAVVFFITCKPLPPIGAATQEERSVEPSAAATSDRAALADELVTFPSTPAPPPLVAWEEEVAHLFFHPLIATPEHAFDGDSFDTFMHEWFLTTGEFNQILEQLYERDYVLVSVYDTVEFSEKDGVRSAKPKAPLVPEGKKPLLLSVDDLNYYPDTTKNGGVQSLFLDADGKLACTVLGADGAVRVSYDAELPLALERFIEKHPDFSLNGARGILALTAYNGFLGYLTNEPKNPNREADTVKAKAVADELKRIGWTFASHSWTHMHPSKFRTDRYLHWEKRWVDEAAPVIGNTDIFIFPFGALPFQDPGKMPVLRSLGYALFYGVERNSEVTMRGDALLGMRVQLDGMVLRVKPKFIEPFVDAGSIVRDPRRRR